MYYPCPRCGWFCDEDSEICVLCWLDECADREEAREACAELRQRLEDEAAERPEE